MRFAIKNNQIICKKDGNYWSFRDAISALAENLHASLRQEGKIRRLEILNKIDELKGLINAEPKNYRL